jgi:nucleoside-diphosphate kinase
MKVMEETLLVLKPDAVVRRFVSVEALKILLSKGFEITAFREMLVPTELAKRHYAVHEGKPFYDWLIRFITSGPVIAMRVQDEDVIQKIRTILGSTFAHKAEPATLRGRYGIYGGVNVAHASDSKETSAEELGLWQQDAGLTKEPSKSIGKRMSSYISTYSSRNISDHTQELRKTCLGIVDRTVSEENGRSTITKLLDSEFQKADRKYLKGFSETVVETCLMDRNKN